MWPEPRGEHIHQILKYVVITPEFLAPLPGNRRHHSKQFVPLIVVGGLTCYLPGMKWIRPPSTGLVHFITEHVTCPCDLEVWSFDSESCHVIRLVFKHHAKFELNTSRPTTYHSSVGASTIFHLLPAWIPIFTFLGYMVSNSICLTPCREWHTL